MEQIETAHESEDPLHLLPIHVQIFALQIALPPLASSEHPSAGGDLSAKHFGDVLTADFLWGVRHGKYEVFLKKPDSAIKAAFLTPRTPQKRKKVAWDTKGVGGSRNLPPPSVLSVVMLSVTLSAQPLQVRPHIHEIRSISTGDHVMHLMREVSAHRTHRMCA